MKLMRKSLTAAVLVFTAVTAIAAPKYLTTINETDVESNAFVAGNIPSPYPTAAHSTRQVYWNMVRIACYGHSTGNKCTALIKMDSNGKNPIDLGTVTMDLDTGEITPAVLSANGYTMTAPADKPGFAVLTKN